MDLGNGYQATYGQLKDITVEPGQTVESGTILATSVTRQNIMSKRAQICTSP